MTEREIEKLNLGRTLRLALPALLAVYEGKKSSAINRLIMSYKSGEKLEPIAAEISVYQNLIDEMKRQAKVTENLEHKAHKT